MKIMYIMLLIMLLSGGAVGGNEEDNPFTQTVNVVYGETDGIGLLLDVYAPLESGTAKKGLGIICVTSGAWKSDRGMMEAHEKFGFFDVLASHGYVVFAVRPGSISLFTADQMLTNVKTGIRWVKTHAAEYSIDPDRIGMVGASAGGHLALLAAACAEPEDCHAENPLMRCSSQVRAVSVFCPPTDFLDWNGARYGLDLMQGQLVFRDGFANRSAEAIELAAKAISPLHQIRAGLPPFLLIHGDADSLVPIQQSVKFVKAVQEHGGSAELIVKEGGDHSWPTVREEIERMADWLDTQLTPATAD